MSSEGWRRVLREDEATGAMEYRQRTGFVSRRIDVDLDPENETR